MLVAIGVALAVVALLYYWMRVRRQARNLHAWLAAGGPSTYLDSPNAELADWLRFYTPPGPADVVRRQRQLIRRHLRSTPFWPIDPKGATMALVDEAEKRRTLRRSHEEEVRRNCGHEWEHFGENSYEATVKGRDWRKHHCKKCGTSEPHDYSVNIDGSRDLDSCRICGRTV